MTTGFSRDPVPVLLDTDANNEIDDQHAIAYLLANADVFATRAITTNCTENGGNLSAHTQEAARVVRLMGCEGLVPVVPGAQGSYGEITRGGPSSPDGREAVDCIIEHARAESHPAGLRVIAVGKLTNVALALHRAPDIAARLRVTWLGSHWPDPGEYNLDNDPEALGRVLHAGIELDVAVVRYHASTGAAAVVISTDDIRSRMSRLGPPAPPTPGRHGGLFTCFGDYSVSLFEQQGPQGALCDLVAVAIVKNPRWAARWDSVMGPWFNDGGWRTQLAPAKTRVRFASEFHAPEILQDLFSRLARPAVPTAANVCPSYATGSEPLSPSPASGRGPA